MNSGVVLVAAAVVGLAGATAMLALAVANMAAVVLAHSRSPRLDHRRHYRGMGTLFAVNVHAGVPSAAVSVAASMVLAGSMDYRWIFTSIIAIAVGFASTIAALVAARIYLEGRFARYEHAVKYGEMDDPVRSRR